MPLDGDVKIFLTIDPLEALGIVPVPYEYVKEYKRNYRLAYFQEHALADPRCAWTLISFEEWKARPGRKKKKLTLTDFLTNPTSSRYTNDKSMAPVALVRLANHVQKAIPTAQFWVDYFDTDPILLVQYDFDGAPQMAYLGIWDQGEIKRIAEHPPITEPLRDPVARWWSRWV